ncbi:hypothetical protein DOY81_010799 [Sarcophaga bullata]|nr:hypothetical protein DOY81_010799 [Sarcophaga bullata]
MDTYRWMDIDFVSILGGSATGANAAKQQIAKYFRDCGNSDRQDAKKILLMFASKILSSIQKCGKDHVDIYCEIVTEVFSRRLQPEANVKYWTLYTNYIRYLHYLLVEKKDFEKAALVYKHISSYDNKLQTSEIGLTYINICCYHLFLQNFLKSIDLELAKKNSCEILENLTQIFKEMLKTNDQKNFEYPDVLNKTIHWLFPKNNIGAVYNLLKMLPEDKVNQMFESLFTLYGKQKIEYNSESLQQALIVIEAAYTFLQIDMMDKMKLQLGVMLLSNCRTESRLQAVRPIAELLLVLHDYIKLLCAQNSILDFQKIYCMNCERFLELFNKYSKTITIQPWFGNLLVLLFYIHSQMQNNLIFNCFWREMCKPQCYKSMFQLFMELMKLAPCIPADTKLYTPSSLTGFVLYCQNVSVADEEEFSNQDSNLANYYKETIQTNLVLIINHAFKIIDKMDCITSNSQEIEIMLIRFKQATLNCRTGRQAGTCITILERFLKIKTKIPTNEWPLLLRRLCKTVNQFTSESPFVGEKYICAT